MYLSVKRYQNGGSFDAADNLLSKTKIDNSGTDTYTYGDSNWPDKLTAYNGNPITYDAIGNPTTYHGQNLQRSSTVR